VAARVERVELRRVALPLVAPFRTASVDLTEREVLLVRVEADGVHGWGECGALPAPGYTAEYVDGAHRILRDHLVPLLFATGAVDGASLGSLLAPVHGHPMARAAIELALLDAELRAAGVSLASHLGGTRAHVECGVSVGRFPAAELAEQVSGYVDEGYRRVKLKILPGYDVQPLATVRAEFPGLTLWVDANGSYSLDDLDALRALDEFGLGLVEQPLPDDDVLGHAAVARAIKTPVCLDETISSARVAQQALELDACSVVNIKAARVGGVFEAVRVHDVCRAQNVPVWCGGMLETGIGRAANLALASLPGFTLPGDLSGSDRYFARDVITDPFTLAPDGTMGVPTGPGLGVEVDVDLLDAVTLDREMLTPA
jgi:O-succinylbenzoate synthase